MTLVLAAAGIAATTAPGSAPHADGGLTVPSPSGTTALAPIEITLSGLDGAHGPVQATVHQAAADPGAETAAGPATAPRGTARAAAPATQPAKRPALAAVSGGPGAEGISLEQAGGAAAGSGLHAHALTAAQSSYDIAANGTSVVTANGIRYVNLNLKVRNAQSCSTPGSCAAYSGAVSNLTLVGAETATTLSQTAISRIRLFDGTNANPALATQILPTDGAIGNENALGGAAKTDDALRSLQLFKESEIAAAPVSSGVTSLLPYGYVVHNIKDPGSRTLPGNPAANDYEGAVTISLAFPTQSVATQNPFSISLVYQPVVDTNTRVTEGPLDQNHAGDLDANARSTALASSDLAVTGGAHVAQANTGDPICTVRTAGTADAPTAYLVNNVSPNVASLPYNELLKSTAGGIRASFCEPMSVASQSAMFSAFVVSGSQSGRRTAGGTYTGSYGTLNAGSTLSFIRSKAFFVGEQISVSLTSGLTSTSGDHPAPFVSSFYVGGQTPSDGHFRSVQSRTTDGTPVAMVSRDFNDDGIPDVVTADSTSNRVDVFWGLGDGNFTGPRTYGVGTTPAGIVAADFNSDGIPDFAVANSGSNNVSVFLGTGTSGFTQPTGSPFAVGTKPVAIAAADIDGNGTVDLVTGNATANTLSVLTGTGTGSFGSAGSIGFSGVGTVQAVATADFTNDGNTDIVMSTSSNKVVLFVSNGSGAFGASGSNIVATGGTNPVALAVGNFDGDGNLDVVTANKGSNNLTLLSGSGTGTFTTTTLATTLSAPDGLAGGDVDGDGHRDLVVSNSGSNTEEVLFGNGSGSFTAPAGATLAVGSAPGDVVVNDLDGDGDLDIVVANATSNTITPLLGDSTRALYTVQTYQPRTIATGTRPVGIATGDFDGDGNLDLAEVNQSANTLEILLGNGNGRFTQPASSPVSVPNGPFGVSTADFNGDGLLDLMVTNYAGSSVTVFQGNGDGTFTSKGSLSTGANPSNIAVGDFNGDGRPDAAVSNFGGGTVSVLLNAGSFTFSSSIVSPAGGAAVVHVETADLNGDGRLDLVVAGAGGSGPIAVELGNGDGTFTAGATYPVSLPQSVQIGDFNGDGIPDLAANTSSGSDVVVLTGNGDGTFTSRTVAMPEADGEYAMTVGDVNGDGYFDILSADRGNGYVDVLLGGPDGPALEDQAPPFHLSAGTAAQLVLGNFFGTGKLGLAATSNSSSVVNVIPQY